MCTWEKTLLEVEIMVDIFSIAEKYGEKDIGADDRADPDDDGDPTPVATITSTWDPNSSSSTSSIMMIPSIIVSHSTKVLTSSHTSYASSYPSPYSSSYQPLPTSLPPNLPPINSDPNDPYNGSDDNEYPPNPQSLPPLTGPPFDLPPPPPPPPPPPTLVIPDSPSPIATPLLHALLKRTVGRYPQQVKIKESRPSKDRLKQVLGISLSDYDDGGRSAPGAVTCKRMIMVDDYALKEDPGDGDGVVTFQEQQVIESYTDDDDDDDYDPDSRRRRRKRTNYDNDAECYCAWRS
jgi:hypothetical protein